MEPADGQVEDSSCADVWCFCVHAVADVVEVERFALLSGEFCDGFEVGFFVHADLAGDDGAHGSCSPCGLLRRRGGRLVFR